MPGKYTEGYTKSAQKQKYVRNRDLKLKDSEVEREQHIQKVMGEGVCTKCREKLQWKFRYDKYKPLKNRATCQECKNKTVVKAYRTFCDACAQRKHVCPGCCVDLDVLAAEEALKPKRKTVSEEDAAAAEVAAAATAVGAPKAKPAAQLAQPIEMAVDEEGEEGEEGEEDEEAEEYEEGEESEEGEEGEEGEAAQDAQADEMGVAVDASLLDETIPSPGAVGMAWDEQKFKNISTNKYSKLRVPGQEL